MKRTNIYLEARQLELLGRAAEEQGTSVARLVRAAVDAWLAGQGMKALPEDEWQRRFRRLLERRRAKSRALGLRQEEVDREVILAVDEVRRARRARRR